MKKPYARLVREGRVRPHHTNSAEIDGLFAVVGRDLADAAIETLSADRRFATAYNAVLQAATALMYAEGYRTTGPGHHRTTFDFLGAISAAEFGDLAAYFDDCRRKRNKADYVGVGYVSFAEAEYLLEEARKFAAMARSWIRDRHPELMLEESL
ncbi:MAG: SAV_6107 family HEPN domain-containing protein [Anaerolineae bacterium]